MTQENKELLLKDLSARLPYKTIVQIDGWGIWDLRGIDHDNSTELRDRVCLVWEKSTIVQNLISNNKLQTLPLTSFKYN